MSGNSDQIIIGLTDGDEVNPGETFFRNLAFTDGTDPHDLTSGSIEISEASPPFLKTDIVLAIDAGTGGTATLTISPTNMEKLSLGVKSWFRIKTTLASGFVDVTPKIWIKVT